MAARFRQWSVRLIIGNEELGERKIQETKEG
jgi:hypothetical protein